MHAPRGAGIESKVPVQKYRQYMARSHERCEPTRFIRRYFCLARHPVASAKNGRDNITPRDQLSTTCDRTGYNHFQRSKYGQHVEPGVRR